MGTPLAPVMAKKKPKTNARLIVGLSAAGGGVLLIALMAILFWPSTPKSPAARNDLALPGAVTEPPEWLLDDAPFDVAKYFEAPTPEENAAPLYIDALFEFEFDMADCFSDPERQRRGEIVQMRQGQFNDMYTSWKNDPSSVDGAAIDTMLAEYDVGFQKLALAQRRPHCAFQAGINVMALLPHASAATNVCHVARMQAVRDLSRRDLDGAISRLETVLRLSRDLRPRGQLVSQLVSIAIDRMVSLDVIPKILAMPGITTQQCDRLVAMLRENEYGTGVFQEGLQADYIMVRSFLFDVEHRTGIFNSDTPIGRQIAEFAVMAGIAEPNEQEKLTRGYGVLVDKIDFPEELNALTRFYQATLDSRAAPLRTRQEQFLQLIRAAEEEGRLFTLVLASYDSFMDAVSRGRTQHGGTMCLIALCRWQLENDGPPTDLATMAKAAGLESVPIDPYSGEPMKMTTIDGRPVIHSIGPDEKDDQGRVEFDPDTPESGGDILFRLP